MAFRNLAVYRGGRVEGTSTRLSISQKDLVVRPAKQALLDLGWKPGDKLAPWFDDDTGVVRILPDPRGWKLVRSGGGGRRLDAHQVRFPTHVGKTQLFGGSPDKLPATIVETRPVDSDGVRGLEFRLPWREATAAPRRSRKQPAPEPLPRTHRISWTDGGVPTINWAYVEQAAQAPMASDAWAMDRLLLWAREVMFDADVADLLVLRPPQPLPPTSAGVENAPRFINPAPQVDETPVPVDRTPLPVDDKPDHPDLGAAAVPVEPEPKPTLAAAAEPAPPPGPPKVEAPPRHQPAPWADAREKGRTFSAERAPKAPAAPALAKRSCFEDRWDAKTRWKFIEEAARGKGDRILMDIGGCAAGSLWAIKKRLAPEIAARRAAIVAERQDKTKAAASPPAAAPVSTSSQPPPPWGNGADVKTAPPLSDEVLAYVRTEVAPLVRGVGFRITKTRDGAAFEINGDRIELDALVARVNEVLELEGDERLVLPPALTQPQEGTNG